MAKTQFEVSEIKLVVTDNNYKYVEYTLKDGPIHSVGAIPVGIIGKITPESSASAGDSNLYGGMCYPSTEYTFHIGEGTFPESIHGDGAEIIIDGTTYAVGEEEEAVKALMDIYTSVGGTSDLDVDGGGMI